MKGAQHLSKSPEHGTPMELIELAHQTMGGIDVDPASSARWNERVKAARYIDRAQDGLSTPWLDGAPSPRNLIAGDPRRGNRKGRLFVNPPGDPEGVFVVNYWRAVATYWLRDWFGAAYWVGFNIEQLSRLQRVGAASHPLQHITLIPAVRSRYINGDGKRNDTPPHSSFVTFLARDGSQVEQFQSLAKRFGYVINGDRR